MTIFNNLIDNNYIILSICTVSVCLITGYFIKRSYFSSTVNETPNSPQTFNFTSEQLKEINYFLDEGNNLDKETQDKLDEDFKTLIGEDLYSDMTQELGEINNQFTQELAEIFTNFF